MTTHHDHPGDWTCGPWTEEAQPLLSICCRKSDYEIAAWIERNRGAGLPFIVFAKSRPGFGPHDVELRAASVKEAKHLADFALRAAGYTLKDEPSPGATR